MNKAEIQATLQRRANRMVSEPTEAEAKLLELLKSANVKFKQQKIVFSEKGGFIIDCYLKNLVGKRFALEVDGDQHRTNREYDEWRTEWLNERRRIKVIRFSNHEVLCNPNEVLSRILSLNPVRKLQ